MRFVASDQRTRAPTARAGAVLLGAACLLASCGGPGSGTGVVPAGAATPASAHALAAPVAVVSYTPAQLTTLLQSSTLGQAVLAAAGAPHCSVAVYRFTYATVGGAGEAAVASAALMLPSGGGCTGARPILEFAHGTAAMQSYNIAALDQTGNEAWPESALIATMFAARGLIVVAPNYVGYDTQDVATLAYHPYLNGAQQSQEMIDALRAARTALVGGLQRGLLDSGALLLSGNSQGGYVALATHRAMQAAGMRVTASAPMSGPYALGAIGDAIIFGNVPLHATLYFPLIVESYQRAYGNLYSTTSDYFALPYATGIDTLLPSSVSYKTLVKNGLLPQWALFDSTTPVPPQGTAALDAALAVPPATATGNRAFGSPYLVTNGYVRVNYGTDALAHPDGAYPTARAGVPQALAPTYPLRVAFKRNDLRNWAPDGTAPVQLCGGHNDPQVGYALNTGTMAAFWPGLVATGVVRVLDVDPDTAAPLAVGGFYDVVANAANSAFEADRAGGVGTASQYGTDVGAAILALYPREFSSTAQGPVPNSPAGRFIQAVAEAISSVAVTDATTVLGGGADTFHADAHESLLLDYHSPAVELACAREVREFFKNVLVDAARRRHRPQSAQ